MERFGQIVATNRGALVAVFTDEAMALGWLLARPKKPWFAQPRFLQRAQASNARGVVRDSKIAGDYR